jgi:hypothetical protein
MQNLTIVYRRFAWPVIEQARGDGTDTVLRNS